MITKNAEKVVQPHIISFSFDLDILAAFAKQSRRNKLPVQYLPAPLGNATKVLSRSHSLPQMRLRQSPQPIFGARANIPPSAA